MLLLDAGNTRIKWAFAKDGAWLAQGAAAVEDEPALRQAFAALPRPARILACNVAGAAVAERLRAACAAWNCGVEFIAAQAEQCGVRNGYADPGQLGSDRWAALVGAWAEARAACLVVNCGTATTIDALSASGEFRGGLILPGLDMMRRSLADGAAQLQLARGNWDDFPRNTADAMYSGALKATIGAIRLQHALLGQPPARCVLSGGAAGHIEAHLGLPLMRLDDLVLRGLRVIGQENDRV